MSMESWVGGETGLRNIAAINKPRRMIDTLLLLAVALGAAGCGGGGAEPVPVSRFDMLAGKKVLVLPVQYVRRTEGPWIGGARNEQAAARLADTEIGFALGEESSRAEWILPPAQVEAVERRPMLAVNPYALSADEARRGGGKFKWIRDPLYGEIRVLVAVFDARYIVWPIEVFYDKDEETNSGRVVIRTVFVDGRSGDVLWQGNIFGQDEPPTSPGALASAAQAFAREVSP